MAVVRPDLARSERDEEEIREGVDGERLNEHCVFPLSSHLLPLRRPGFRARGAILLLFRVRVPSLSLLLACHVGVYVARSCVLVCVSTYSAQYCSPRSRFAPSTCTLGYLVLYLTLRV